MNIDQSRARQEADGSRGHSGFGIWHSRRSLDVPHQGSHCSNRSNRNVRISLHDQHNRMTNDEWRMPSPHTPRAMTLVEILAVVVILGLIAGTLVIGFSGSFGKAKHELAKSGIGVVVSKLELYRIEHGAWPSNDTGLAALSDGEASPSDPYYLSRDQLLDPWGNHFILITPGPNGLPYEVISYGSDGQSGGAPGSEESDISSANLREEASR